jgi:DNA-directed RNA polymerase sigma subunit (sigma70/sigma32)
LMNLTEKERLLIMSQFWFLKEELSKEELSKRTSIHKDKINNVTSRIINKLRDMDCLKINT